MSVLLIITYIISSIFISIFTKKQQHIIEDISSNKKNIYYFIIFHIIPILCFVEYFLYNPSFSDFINYYKTSFDISTNYSEAMSTDSPGTFITYIILLIVFIFLIPCLLIKFRIKKYLHLLICLVPIFFSYKSTVVRNDEEHILIALEITSVTLSIALMLFAINTPNDFISKKIPKLFIYHNKIIHVIGIIIIFLATILCSFSNSYNIQSPKIKIQIPTEIKEKIDNKTVTSYPWDILWSANNQLNYVCFPTLQSYVAFDPYLDQKNADFFNSTSAPDYIIWEQKSIDDRLLEWESPKTYFTIFTNYEYSGLYYEYNYRKIYLLQKKAIPPKASIISKNTIQSQIDRSIDIPLTQSIKTISFNTSKKNISMLKKSLFRTEPLYINMEFSDNSIKKYRILPSQMESELPLSIFSFTNVSKEIKRISFSGKDLKLYDKDITITITEYNI